MAAATNTSALAKPVNSPNMSSNNKTITANIVNPISFANFKLSNAQNTREFLANSAYNREKNTLRNKRYSQLVDTETFDYNRNHPLIDNLIIHVENSKEANKLSKEEALQEIAKLTAKCEQQSPNTKSASRATPTLVATIATPKYSEDRSGEDKKKFESAFSLTTSNDDKSPASVTKNIPVFELTTVGGRNNRPVNNEPVSKESPVKEVIAKSERTNVATNATENKSVGEKNARSSDRSIQSELKEETKETLVSKTSQPIPDTSSNSTNQNNRDSGNSTQFYSNNLKSN